MHRVSASPLSEHESEKEREGRTLLEEDDVVLAEAKEVVRLEERLGRLARRPARHDVPRNLALGLAALAALVGVELEAADALGLELEQALAAREADVVAPFRRRAPEAGPLPAGHEHDGDLALAHGGEPCGGPLGGVGVAPDDGRRVVGGRGRDVVGGRGGGVLLGLEGGGVDAVDPGRVDRLELGEQGRLVRGRELVPKSEDVALAGLGPAVAEGVDVVCGWGGHGRGRGLRVGGCGDEAVKEEEVRSCGRREGRGCVSGGACSCQSL